MITKEVASLSEALIFKEEQNYTGDYILQTWTRGRELILALPDSLLSLRWVDYRYAQLTTPIINPQKDNETIPITSNSQSNILRGSNIFTKPSDGGR